MMDPATPVADALTKTADQLSQASEVAARPNESRALLAYSHLMRELASRHQFTKDLASIGFVEADMDRDVEELITRFTPLVDQWLLPVRFPFSRLGWASKLAWTRAVAGGVISSIPAFVELLPQLEVDIWQVHLTEGRVSMRDALSGRRVKALAFMVPMPRGLTREKSHEEIAGRLAPHVKALVGQLRGGHANATSVSVELTAFIRASLFSLGDDASSVPILLRSTVKSGQHYTRMVGDLAAQLERVTGTRSRSVRGGGRRPEPTHAHWWALAVFEKMGPREIAEEVAQSTGSDPEDLADTVSRALRALGLAPSAWAKTDEYSRA